MHKSTPGVRSQAAPMPCCCVTPTPLASASARAPAPQPHTGTDPTRTQYVVQSLQKNTWKRPKTFQKRQNNMQERKNSRTLLYSSACSVAGRTLASTASKSARLTGRRATPAVAADPPAADDGVLPVALLVRRAGLAPGAPVWKSEHGEHVRVGHGHTGTWAGCGFMGTCEGT